MKRPRIAALVLVAAAVVSLSATQAPGRLAGVNVLLRSPVSQDLLVQLETFGRVREVIPEIKGVTMLARESDIPAIAGLPFVASASLDQPRSATPILSQAVTDFSDGLNTWNLDAVNVTDFPTESRVVDEDGTGVYVAVLDTGLLRTWPTYFPADRIATTYARCFGGGGGNMGFVSTQPNKWEEDQDAHGTHVTSSIIGYSYFGVVGFNGVAPRATIIPVKVLNQNGSGWSSVIARGIVYVADLKSEELAGSPVVINMSLGGPRLDPMEEAAIDYAIGQGVIIVAAAGNHGTRGMDYPGAYEPVISAAASGWTSEWTTPDWWYNLDVADPTNADDFYIEDFSGRAKAGQDLDVAAPGSWVVGPYQTNGQLSYYFLGGTSMATPHVSGIVALMAQKDLELTASQAETILETTAVALPAGCRDVTDPSGAVYQFCWGSDANGAGLAQADTALMATPLSMTSMATLKGGKKK
jgi:subtilisin family serine protease